MARKRDDETAPEKPEQHPNVGRPIIGPGGAMPLPGRDSVEEPEPPPEQTDQPPAQSS